jgi:hypothetical protein
MAIPILFGKCVYTIVDLVDLDAHFAAGGVATISEGKRWATAKEMLAESNAASCAMPIFFSDAASTGELHYWAVVSDVQMEGQRSFISLRGMRRFKNGKPKQSSLIVDAKGRPHKLSMSHIKPYVMCQTPGIASALYRKMQEAIEPPQAKALVADEASEFPEGRKLFRFHSRIERNRKLVQLKKSNALAIGRLRCEVCTFDFQAVYGDVGDGFIECHHNVPISEYDANQKTRLQDLALVCSNCHRILHRKRPWQTVEALKAVLRKQQESRPETIR